MAEVLITLTVIGVVAAITLPPLVQNYQKMVLVNQLKKEYSLWNQIFQKVLADEEVSKLSDTHMFKAITVNCSSGWSSICDDADIFFDDLKKYVDFKIVHKANQRNNGYQGGTHQIDLNDGSIIRDFYLYFNQPEHVWWGKASFNIDVNGLKGPNTIGYDVFRFYIGDNGMLFPEGGKEYARRRGNAYYWKNNELTCGDKNNSTINLMCTARIMENGWKMDY